MKNTTNENGEASEASQLKENLMKSVDVARSRLERYLIRLVQISRFMFSVCYEVRCCRGFKSRQDE